VTDKIRKILSSINASEQDITDYLNDLFDYGDDDIYKSLTDQEIIDDFREYIN
jgi:hypothetical protein